MSGAIRGLVSGRVLPPSRTMRREVFVQSDPLLTRIVDALCAVPGITAIALGGSRARGTALEASDYDIGLYFTTAGPVDIARLQQAVRALVDDPDAADVTELGGWGPWIVGGAWLSIEGRKVDLLYREIDAVARVIAACRSGRIEMHYQPGHPHGFVSAIWMGEVALCRVLYDPTRALTDLKASCTPYPAALREAIIRRFQWEISFSVENAELGLARADHTHIAGCAYRALACLAQVLFALNERYLINEKGALLEAASLPRSLPSLALRVADVWKQIGSSDFRQALSIIRALEAETRALI